MLAYYLLLGVPLLSAVLFRLSGRKTLARKRVNPTLIVFFSIFFLLIALRNYRIGSDTLGYKLEFERIGGLGLNNLFVGAEREFGFLVLTKLISFISPSFRLYLIVMSLLTVVPLAWYYQEESEYPLLTIALFVAVAPFSMYFSGVRQILAMSLGVIAWRMAKNRKLIWFLVIVFLAVMFHMSAFVLLLMYPLYRVRITSRWLFLVVPAIALIYIFNKPIFNFLAGFLWKDYSGIESTGAFTVLMLLILFAVYSYVVPQAALLDGDTIALRNLLLFSIALQCFAPIHPLAMRLNYYYLLFIPILIPKIAVRSKPGLRKLVTVSVLVMMVGFAAYFIYNGYNGKDVLRIFPYILLGTY